MPFPSFRTLSLTQKLRETEEKVRELADLALEAETARTARARFSTSGSTNGPVAPPGGEPEGKGRPLTTGPVVVHVQVSCGPWRPPPAALLEGVNVNAAPFLCEQGLAPAAVSIAGEGWAGPVRRRCGAIKARNSLADFKFIDGTHTS